MEGDLEIKVQLIVALALAIGAFVYFAAATAWHYRVVTIVTASEAR